MHASPLHCREPRPLCPLGLEKLQPDSRHGRWFPLHCEATRPRASMVVKKVGPAGDAEPEKKLTLALDIPTLSHYIYYKSR